MLYNQRDANAGTAGQAEGTDFNEWSKAKINTLIQAQIHVMLKLSHNLLVEIIQIMEYK